LRYRSVLTGENGTTPQFIFPRFFGGSNPIDFAITFNGRVIQLIDPRSETVQSIELVPGAAFYYRYIHPVVNLDPSFNSLPAGKFTSWALHILYYAVVFFPVAILLSLPAIRLWPRKYWASLFLTSLFVLPFLLELALVLPNGLSLRPMNIIVSALILATVTLVALPISRRVLVV
jgi:hypothetical protein